MQQTQVHFDRTQIGIDAEGRELPLTGQHRTKQTLALKKGERVILLVDPSNPERAFIRDLYF